MAVLPIFLESFLTLPQLKHLHSCRWRSRCWRSSGCRRLGRSCRSRGSRRSRRRRRWCRWCRRLQRSLMFTCDQAACLAAVTKPLELEMPETRTENVMKMTPKRKGLRKGFGSHSWELACAQRQAISSPRTFEEIKAQTNTIDSYRFKRSQIRQTLKNCSGSNN